MELLSLKWNKHSRTFFSLLSTLREQESHTDVYLGCEGQLFPVHQIVLTICSDYFASIFRTYKANSPVIILKDVRKTDLEYLLDYMYLGEVNVKQSELPDLITAAELLQIKGLAVEDDPDASFTSKRPLTPEPIPSTPPKRARKRYRKPRELIPEIDESQDSHFSVAETGDNSGDLHPVVEIKLEGEDSLCDDIANSQVKNENSTRKRTQLSDAPLEELAGHEIFEKEEHNDGYESSVDTAPENSSLSYELPASPTSAQSEQMFNQMMSCKPIEHTNVKYYTCKICGKVMTKIYNAKIHLRMHTGEKPCKCPYCNFRCNDPSSLRGHVKRRHGKPS